MASLAYFVSHDGLKTNATYARLVRRLAQQDAFALLYSLSRYVQHSKTCPISILRPYGEHTSPPAHSLNLICIGKLLIYKSGSPPKAFSVGQTFSPDADAVFCLHELRMQIRCRKTAIPSKALLLSSAFLLTNPAHSVNKIKVTAVFPAQTPKKDTCRRHFARTM